MAGSGFGALPPYRSGAVVPLLGTWVLLVELAVDLMLLFAKLFGLIKKPSMTKTVEHCSTVRDFDNLLCKRF